MSPATAANVSEFLALVHDARPLLDIRDLLVTWVNAGCGRDDLRSILNEALEELRAKGTEDEEDLILEALDLVEGWCSPHLELPYPD